MFSFGKHLKYFLPILFYVQFEGGGGGTDTGRDCLFVCLFGRAAVFKLNSGREGTEEGTSRTCAGVVV